MSSKAERFGQLPADTVLPEPVWTDNPPRAANVCTPRVAQDETEWYPPVMIGADAIGREVTDDCRRYLEEGVALLDRLDPDPYLEYLKEYYRLGLERFGERWGYVDILTAVLGLGRRLKPNSYLEIGVRRGRSVCALASLRPNAHIAMFDMWVPNYAGMDNPGADHVNKELDKIGHLGKREFVDGDSHKTLKEYFAANPDAYFDLITVDGDHSNLGAAEDIADVLPRLSIGGAILFDDTCNPNVAGLGEVWRRMLQESSRFTTFTYSDAGYGIGFAIRRS